MDKTTRTIWIVIGVLALIAFAAWLISYFRRNGNRNGANGTTRIIERDTTSQNYYPYYVPVQTGPQPVKCPANTSTLQCNKKPSTGCVNSYSTPDGKTWTLDNAQSTADCCCYVTTSAPPVPVPQPIINSNAFQTRSFAQRR